MANNDDDDFDLDDFDVDDFSSDFEDIESKTNPDIDSSKRAPITEAIKGSIAGAKSTLDDSSKIKDFIVSSLPKEYGAAISEVDEGVSNLSTLYDDSIRELKPKVKSITTKIKRLIPEKHEKIRDLLTRIEENTSTFQGGTSTSRADIENRSIATITDSIFNDQAQKDKEELLKETIDTKKFKVGLDVNTSIRDSINRLTDYTTKVTQAYQKKSLELQYRSYFIQNRLLETTTKYLEVFNNQNKAIITNTALPEYVKVQDSERFKEASKARIIGKLQDRLFSDKGLISTISTNVTSQVKDVVSGIGGILEAGTTQLDNQELAGELEELGGGPKKSAGTKFGEFIGGGIGNTVKDNVSDRIRDKIKPGSKIHDLGVNINDAIKDPSILKDKILDSDTFKNAELGSKTEALGELLSDLLSTKSGKFSDSVKDTTEGLHQPGVYTNRTNKSIVEVIPGYLSRILREVNILRTGNASSPLTVFDYNKSSFTTSTQLGNRIEKQIADRLKQSGLKRKTTKLTDTLLANSELSITDKEEATRLIQDSIISGSATNVTSIKKHLKRSDSPIAKQLVESIEGNTTNVSELSRSNATIRDIRSSLTGITPEVAELLDSGQSDILKERGILTSLDGKSFSINKDKYIDLANGNPTTIQDTTTSTTKANSPISPTIAAAEANTNTTGTTKANSPIKPTNKTQETIRNKPIDSKALTSIDNKLDTLTSIHSDTTGILEILKSGITIHMGDGTSVTGNGNGTIINTAKGFIDKIFEMGGGVLKTTISTLKSAKDNLISPLITKTFDTLKSDKTKEGLKGLIASSYELGSNLIKKSITAIDEAVTKGKGLLSLAFNTGKKTVSKLLEYAGDIYIPNLKSPVMLSRLMKIGHYLDEKTGDVIKSVKDIKGTVIDKDGNIILSIDDIKKGLLDRTGKEIKLPIEKILNFAKGAISNGIGRLKGAFSTIKGIGSGIIDKVTSPYKGFGASDKSYNVLVEIRDLIKGYMGNGGESTIVTDDSTESVTDDVVDNTDTTLSPTSNPVINDTFKTVADKVKATTSTVRNKVKATTSNKGKKGKLGSIFNRIRDSKVGSILGGITNTIPDTPSIVKSKVKDVIKKVPDKVTKIRTKLGKSKFNDTNKDGTRDNSAKDRLEEEAKREKERKKGPKEADLQERYRGANVIDKMLGMFKGAFSKIGGLLEGAKDLATAKGLKDILSKGKGVLSKGGSLIKGGVKNLGKVVSKIPKVGGLGSIAKTVLSVGRVGLLAGGSFLASAATTAFAALGTAASAAGAALSAPVVLGAAAVALTGYGAYKGFKYLTRNNYDKYQTIRLHQYGLTLTDTDKAHVHNLLSLEEYLADKVGYDKGRAYILKGRIKPEELLGLFSIDKDDKSNIENFLTWFTTRFKPFYLTHMTSLFSVNNKTKLDDVSDLDTNAIIQYLNMVSFDDGPYNVKTSPFKDINELPNTLALAKAAINTLVGTTRKTLNAKFSKRDVDKTIKNADDIKQGSTNKEATDHLNKVANKQRTKTKVVTTTATKYTPPFSGEEPKPDTRSTVDAQKTSGSISNTAKLPDRGGDINDGEYGLNFIKLQSGVTLDGVNDNLLTNLKGMAQEYNEITGKTIQVNSAYRSAALQAKLYRQNPHKAAKPGRSLHGFGLAIDAQTNDLNKLEKLGLMRKYGFTRPVAGETWHMEPAGIQPYLQEAKTNTPLADDLIKNSIGKGGGGVATIPGTRKHTRNTKYALSLLKPTASEAAAKQEKEESAPKLVASNANPKPTINTPPALKVVPKTKSAIIASNVKASTPAQIKTLATKSKIKDLPDIETKPVTKSAIIASNDKASTPAQIKTLATKSKIKDLPDIAIKPVTKSAIIASNDKVVKDGKFTPIVKKDNRLVIPKTTSRTTVDEKQVVTNTELDSTVGNIHATLSDSLSIQQSMLEALNTIMQHTNPDNLEQVKATVSQATQRPTNTVTPQPALSLKRRAI